MASHEPEDGWTERITTPRWSPGSFNQGLNQQPPAGPSQAPSARRQTNWIAVAALIVTIFSMLIGAMLLAYNRGDKEREESWRRDEQIQHWREQGQEENRRRDEQIQRWHEQEQEENRRRDEQAQRWREQEQGELNRLTERMHQQEIDRLKEKEARTEEENARLRRIIDSRLQQQLPDTREEARSRATEKDTEKIFGGSRERPKPHAPAPNGAPKLVELRSTEDLKNYLQLHPSSNAAQRCLEQRRRVLGANRQTELFLVPLTDQMSRADRDELCSKTFYAIYMPVLHGGDEQLHRLLEKLAAGCHITVTEIMELSRSVTPNNEPTNECAQGGRCYIWTHLCAEGTFEDFNSMPPQEVSLR